MSQPFHTTRRVQFRDTDASGLVHFSAFFHYMEEAEHELLRHLGLSVYAQDEAGTISWPRVAVRCEFQSPVRFEDVLDIEAQVVRVGEKSVTYEFAFSHRGRPVAAGQITAVCCRIAQCQPPCSIPIPAEIAAKLRA